MSHLRITRFASVNATRVHSGEIRVSAEPKETFVCYALGSCVAIALYDTSARVGGLAHISLPSSKESAHEIVNRLCFADIAVPELLERALSKGANRKSLRVALAGGAAILDTDQYFQIGRKNSLAVKRLLWQAGVFVCAEAIGGTEWRSLWLEVGAGRLVMQTPSGYEELSL